MQLQKEWKKGKFRKSKTLRENGVEAVRNRIYLVKTQVKFNCAFIRSLCFEMCPVISVKTWQDKDKCTKNRQNKMYENYKTENVWKLQNAWTFQSQKPIHKTKNTVKANSLKKLCDRCWKWAASWQKKDEKKYGKKLKNLFFLKTKLWKP